MCLYRGESVETTPILLILVRTWQNDSERHDAAEPCLLSLNHSFFFLHFLFIAYFIIIIIIISLQG